MLMSCASSHAKRASPPTHTQGYLGSYLRLRTIGGGLDFDGWSLDLGVQKTWIYIPLATTPIANPFPLDIYTRGSTNNNNNNNGY